MDSITQIALGAAVGEAVPVVFPVTFPVAFGRAVVTTNMATTANIGSWVDSPSQSGMNVRSGVGNVGASIYWFAIGY